MTLPPPRKKPMQIQRERTKTRMPSLPSSIQGEITTTNINHDDNITEIKIPNYVKPIKLSQYADDSTLSLKEQK